jgi:hypothetical protein
MNKTKKLQMNVVMSIEFWWGKAETFTTENETEAVYVLSAYNALKDKTDYGVLNVELKEKAEGRTIEQAIEYWEEYLNGMKS